MHRLDLSLVGIALALLAGVLSGCGGSVGINDQAPAEGKIEEYVGDGHGGTKPIFDLSGFLVGVIPQTVGSTLSDGSSYTSSSVQAGDVSWYRLAPQAAQTAWIVTLQPTANEDSDLRMFQWRGSKTGWTQIGLSTRLPSTSTSDAPRGGGYAPDWACGTAVPNYPVQVAVYGDPTTAGYKHYRVEADIVVNLPLNVETDDEYLSRYNSDWFRFAATAGKHYTVRLTAVSGDPDFYVYKSSSTGYVTRSEATGGGSAGFTANADTRYYIRVYGYESSNRYTLKLTSP